MRTATLALVLLGVCATSAAHGQARVLTAPDQAPPAQSVPPGTPADENQLQPNPQILPQILPQESAPEQQPAVTGHEPEPAPAPAQNAEQNAAPEQGQNPAQPPIPGRYSFNRVEGGLLRLDRKSGEVALCRPISSGWVCDAVPEERTALEKQIDDLQAEVSALKKEVASLHAPPPPPVPPQTVPPTPPSPPVKEDGAASIKLPTAEDIARARAFLTDTWHRLVDMIENWQKDVLRKS